MALTLRTIFQQNTKTLSNGIGNSESLVFETIQLHQMTMEYVHTDLKTILESVMCMDALNLPIIRLQKTTFFLSN